MKIEGHETEENAGVTRLELQQLLKLVLEQQHIMRKRLVWLSILAQLIFAGIAAILYFGSHGLF